MLFRSASSYRAAGVLSFSAGVDTGSLEAGWVRVCSLLEVVDVLLPLASAASPAASIWNVCQRWPRTFPPTSGLKIPAFFHRHFASLAVKKQRSTGPVSKGDGTILLFVASVHIYGSSSFFSADGAACFHFATIIQKHSVICF